MKWMNESWLFDSMLRQNQRLYRSKNKDNCEWESISRIAMWLSMSPLMDTTILQGRQQFIVSLEI